MSLAVLRSHVRSVTQSHEEVSAAAAIMLAYERRDGNTMVELHRALRNLGEALQAATAAQRALAVVLAIDPNALTSEDLDDIVAPLLEGTTE